MIYNKISYEIKDQVAYVGFGHKCEKSMTTLDEETFVELRAILSDLSSKEKELKAAVFHTHKDKCFLAGADINLIAAMKSESDAAAGSEVGQILYNSIEDLKIETIACVHGVCLGGGTELILACNTVIASDASHTIMGLPEVKLGLLPGFGGTYRMPIKLGLPKALDLILTGKSLKAKKAKRVGLVTAVYPKERLLKMSLTHLSCDKKKVGFKESLENLAQDNFLTKKIIFQKARENVLKKTKGFYQAPLKILDLMEAGIMKSRSSYLSSEAQSFGELCVSTQSKNLQHLFFMTEKIKKFPGTHSSEKLLDIKRGAALGAGTMGGGLAWLLADNNTAPILKDITKEALELGLKQSSSNFMSAVRRKKMTKDEYERKQRSISAQLNYDGFKNIDLVIEAVVENMDIKKKVFSELETQVRDDAIITSNTSSLSVNEMSEVFNKPERFAGLHFFNPVHKMPLVEIIKHKNISSETLQTLYEWCLKAKKTPVIVGDGPGFLVNRILMPYMNEAGFLLEEGVPFKDIEDACLNFGMPMGPFRLLDEVGIDIGMKVGQIVYDGLGERARACSISQKFVDKGLLGRKTKKGFYLYDEKGVECGVNTEVSEFLSHQKISMDEVEIQMRIFLPMINEAAYVLDDKIVESASDVDLGLVFGIGFPPFKGGLLKYADSEGLESILKVMDKYAKNVDRHRYEPADYLRSLVEKKQKFYDL